MGEEVSTSSTEEWRPVVWLIGIMLLVEGVSGVLWNPFRFWQAYQVDRQQYPMDYVVASTAWTAVHFFLAIGLIVIGIGLLRRKPWSRRAAVVLLGCQFIVFILAAFTTPIYIEDSFVGFYKLSIIRLEFWQKIALNLTPFTLILKIGMLLFLSLPGLQRELEENTNSGKLTDIAERFRIRLPALAPVSLFLGLLFFCWGAGLCLDWFLTHHGPPLLIYQQTPQPIRSNLNLLLALIYLAAGVWLLWNRRWSRQAAMAAAGVGIAYLVNSAIMPIFFLFRYATLSYERMYFIIYLLILIGITLQLGVLVVILLLLLRKAPPLERIEGVGEVVPEG